MQSKEHLNSPELLSPVVIVGAGAAGMGCALAVASRGKPVILLEKTPEFGGTVRQALIHTIGGLFDDQGELLNQGLPAELYERLSQASTHTKKRRIGKTWVLDVDPAVYVQVVTDWLTSCEEISFLCQIEITHLDIEDTAISQVTVESHIDNKTFILQPHALVDTTGSAEVVAGVDTGLVDEGMALAGYIVQLRDIDLNALQFPKGVAVLREIRKAVEQGSLPPECATVWLDTGVYPDEVYAKFSISSSDYQHAHMQTVALKLLDFLCEIPGFSNAGIRNYSQLGIRDGGRIRGEYCLTAADVTTGQQFADAACQAGWPIEHWHPERGVTLEYLPPGQSYAIPLRSLKVAGFSNLWAAGKCLSAEPRAQASARVAGTCWAMGEAVGKHLAGELA